MGYKHSQKQKAHQRHAVPSDIFHQFLSSLASDLRRASETSVGWIYKKPVAMPSKISLFKWGAGLGAGDAGIMDKGLGLRISTADFPLNPPLLVAYLLLRLRNSSGRGSLSFLTLFLQGVKWLWRRISTTSSSSSCISTIEFLASGSTI